jgi:hypothetical protein
LWIRIGFNVDPDPGFYLNTDPDPDPDLGNQTNSDPNGSVSWLQKVNFLILVDFHAPGSGSALQIRIRIQDSQINEDPDPQQ